MLRTIAVGLTALILAHPAHAASSREHAHLRPTVSSLRRLIDRGVERSPTLRELIDRLQQTDVVVFVDYDPALPQDLAGGLRFVARAGSLRLLRISLSRALSVPQSLRMLGHELQHALEVANAPRVVDAASMAMFYRGLSSHGRWGERFDTDAAQHAGELVGSDLLSGQRTRR